MENMTPTGQVLESGFCRDGGFFVIDHSRRRACYAYPSSPHADLARRNKARAIAEMTLALNEPATARIHEDHYLRISEIAKTVRVFAELAEIRKEMGK